MSPSPLTSSRITLSLLVAVEQDGNGFHAYAPALKGLHVDGATQAEALENAKEAACLYILCLIEDNEPIPVGPWLTYEREVVRPQIPKEAVLQDLTIQWPFHETSAVSLGA